jgi:glycerol uptake facilitator-like aquaporin
MAYSKYAAELIGTFMLTFVVWLSINYNLPFATPMMAGLTLGLFVYTIGNLSGAHLNPAVTVGLLSIEKIKPGDALFYVISQFAGAALAKAAALGIAPTDPTIVVGNTLGVGMAEAFGAAILIFGVSSVVFKKVPDAASGLVIGSSLLLGVYCASLFGNGVLNPAVAFGISSFGPMYILGPLVGTVVGAWLYKTLVGHKLR